MSPSLTPKQVLILWYLIGRGGAAWLADIRPEPKPAAAWRALQHSGLVSSEKLQRETPARASRRKKSKGTEHRNPTKRSALWIEVTERGWAWANDHLNAELSTKAECGKILQSWLSRLHVFLQRRGIALAEIMGSPSSPLDAGVSEVSLDARVRDAYLKAAGGTWNKRVRLSELRTSLDGVHRAELDLVLMRMQQHGVLVLYPLDNPKEITSADRDAAIAIGGTRLHIVYMRG